MAYSWCYKKDLDTSAVDMEKKYVVGFEEFSLSDLEEEDVVKFKKNGEIDKRTFNSKNPNITHGGNTPGGEKKSGNNSKLSVDYKRLRQLNVEDPEDLKTLFRMCFTKKDVKALVEKAKSVAIYKENKDMLKFLIEQLFGRASQNMTVSGNEKKPVKHEHKQVEKMDEVELNKYLQDRLVDGNSGKEVNSSKRTKP